MSSRTLEAIDDDLDRVLAALIELRRIVEFPHHAVDASADEAARAQVGDELGVLALAVLHDGGEQHQPRSLPLCEHLVDHLAHRLRREVEPVLRATRHARSCVEEPQVVVDLGHRADGRARIVRGGLLLDGNRGRQPLDVIDIGLLHHREELPGVGGKRFHVTPLALRVEGVEGERRFARAGQPRHDDQPARAGGRGRCSSGCAFARREC